MTNTKPSSTALDSGAQIPEVKFVNGERLWGLGPEAPCLLDTEVYRFWNKTRTKLVVRPKTVKVYTYKIGYSQIKVFKVLVLTDDGYEHVYADVITGTLYREDGTCLSSSNRRITNWRIR
jgi:hypothetical protein